MNILKSLIHLIVAAMIAIPAAPLAGCPLCDHLREYHRAHPENNYEYYEDYLKEQAAKEQLPQE